MMTHLSASNIEEDEYGDEDRRSLANAQRDNFNVLSSENVLVGYTVRRWEELEDGNVSVLLGASRPQVLYRHLDGGPIDAPDAGDENCKKDLKMGLEVVSAGTAIISSVHTLATLAVDPGTCTVMASSGMMCRIL